MFVDFNFVSRAFSAFKVENQARLVPIRTASVLLLDCDSGLNPCFTYVVHAVEPLFKNTSRIGRIGDKLDRIGGRIDRIDLIKNEPASKLCGVKGD